MAHSYTADNQTNKMAMAVAACLIMFIMSVSAERSPEEVDNINLLIDTLIQMTTSGLREMNKAMISVPDLQATFKKKIAFAKISGGVKFTGGTLKDLTTLERTGYATLTQYKDKGVLRVLLGLKTLQLYFDHFRAWLGKLSISERLMVTAGYDSIDIQVSVFDDGTTCRVTLDHVKINELGDIKLSVRGLGVLNGIVKDVEKLIVNHFKNNICSLIEKELYEQISKDLNKLDLCAILM